LRVPNCKGLPTVADKTWRVAIVGASGYTGAELVRLLADHPAARIDAMTAERKVGQSLGDVFAHLAVGGGPASASAMVGIDSVEWAAIDVAFLALPHGAGQALVRTLPERVRIIDLSADFRLADTEVFARWYGQPHAAPELQPVAVYGLTEHARERVRLARLVACPGCYPTSALLPLLPLLTERRIEVDEIIIDSKSGVSGAGRAAKEGSLFAEVAEGIHAYGVASHRHAPEIEQALSLAAGRPVVVSFTPHLMPMNRGILSTIYVRLAAGVTAEDARATLARRYAREPFVAVLPMGQIPATRHVRGSNHCLIGVVADRLAGRAIIVSVIDNLVKGASGQAVQNFNVITGLAETTGLGHRPLFP
jgi:N-acetyl-gamma-glutamyl-phosphate reductase